MSFTTNTNVVISSSSSSKTIQGKKSPFKKVKLCIIEEKKEEKEEKEEIQHYSIHNSPFSGFLIYSEEENQKIDRYLHTLGAIELRAIKIAKDHLKSSFSITRSNDYIEWKKSNP